MYYYGVYTLLLYLSYLYLLLLLLTTTTNYFQYQPRSTLYSLLLLYRLARSAVCVIECSLDQWGWLQSPRFYYLYYTHMKISTHVRFHYDVVTTEQLKEKIKTFAGAQIANNTDSEKSKGGLTRSQFSFFMPTDEGNKLVAQLLSYEWVGTVLVDYVDEKKYTNAEALVRQPDANLDECISSII